MKKILLLSFFLPFGFWGAPNVLSSPSSRPIGLQKSPHRRTLQQVKWVQSMEQPAFLAQFPLYPNQSSDWKAHMKKVGKSLTQNHVRRIVFVHGTFVGDDPFGIYHLLESMPSSRLRALFRKLRKQTKKLHDSLLQDAGNFTTDYVHFFCKALQSKIPCSRLSWNSANNHIARLQGTFRIVSEMQSWVQKKDTQKGRILLIGHSHAGQLFALLSHFLEKTSLGQKLLSVEMPNKQERRAFWKKMTLFSSWKWDVVTMGTPARYAFHSSPRIRYLHLINHRGRQVTGGNLMSSLYTRFGDSIQQWGIEGSDTLPTSPLLYQKNKQLVPFLGKSVDPRHLWKQIQKKRRLHEIGMHALVDYRDDGKQEKNAFQTVFGHAIYTRYSSILTNSLLIRHFLYQTTKNDSNPTIPK